MHEHRRVARLVHLFKADPVVAEAREPLLAIVILGHPYPHVGVDGVGAGDSGMDVVGDGHAAPWRCARWWAATAMAVSGS